jgi:hypothetical protein
MVVLSHTQHYWTVQIQAWWDRPGRTVVPFLGQLPQAQAGLVRGCVGGKQGRGKGLGFPSPNSSGGRPNGGAEPLPEQRMEYRAVELTLDRSRFLLF